MNMQIPVHICRIRKKIEDAEKFLREGIIKSANGIVGYAISANVVRLWDEIYHEEMGQ